MKKKVVLYIDTADAECTRVSLRIGSEFYKLESKRDEKKSQATLKLIEKILKNTGIKASDIDTIEVNKGPGSFTGLRVGMAIANAMSFALLIRVNGKDLGDIEIPTYEEN